MIIDYNVVDKCYYALIDGRWRKINTRFWLAYRYVIPVD